MNIKSLIKEAKETLSQADGFIFDKLKLDPSDLVNATKNADADEVARVLNAWVNPNRRDGLNRIPLPFAVDNNHALITMMLLIKGAKPNVLGHDYESPLYKAVIWENREIIELLLEYGAKVDFPNTNKKTPLMAAQEAGFESVVDILKAKKRSRKLKITQEDLKKHNELKQKAKAVKAQKEAQTEIERIKEKHKSLSQFEINYGKLDPQIAFFKAVEAKDSKSVKLILNQIDDLNFENQNGLSPIEYALQLKNEKLACFLIDNGVLAFQFFKDGNSILTKAIHHKMEDLIELILSQPNIKKHLNDKKHILSPLFLAVKSPKIFNQLLKAGALPNYGGSEGGNPISKSVEVSSVAMLPVFVLNNIDLKAKFDGKTLIEWAMQFGKKDWIGGLEYQLDNTF